MSQEITRTCRGCSKEFTYTRHGGRGGPPRLFCPKCIAKRDKRVQAFRKLNMYLGSKDSELLEEIEEALDVNTSDAVRTAIRVYSAILKK